MITQKELKTLLSYNPDTGIFTWNTSRNGAVVVGSIAGTVQNRGYIAIKLNGKSYLAHRLAIIYMHGNTLIDKVDHKDQNRTNNSLSNLRVVSSQINSQNVSTYSSNTSGVMGVKWHKRDKVWEAQITVNKVRIHLGRFKVKVLAVLARKKAEVLYGFYKNHGRTKELCNESNLHI